ncbi:MAG: hypothetical protein V4850_16350 [Myxococcota bacterium]
MELTTVKPPSRAIRAVVEAADALSVDLPALVALTARWAPLAAHASRVSPQNPTGAVYPGVRRARLGSGEKLGAAEDGTRLDRNNYAGAAIRAAVRASPGDLEGYQACHVWPNTCYDARYHTVLANLVLVPAPLVSLTDHHPDVMAALQYRAWAAFGWRPAEAAEPLQPARYPTRWRAPDQPTEKEAAPRPSRTAPPIAPQRVETAPPPVLRVASPLRATGATAPPAGSQRDVMRALWKRYRPDEGAVVTAYAAAEHRGEVARTSNDRRVSAEDYARRLLYDGLAKGWLR